MAEFLIKNFSPFNGDIVEDRIDDSKYGKEELNTEKFIIIKCPEIPFVTGDRMYMDKWERKFDIKIVSQDNLTKAMALDINAVIESTDKKEVIVENETTDLTDKNLAVSDVSFLNETCRLIFTPELYTELISRKLESLNKKSGVSASIKTIVKDNEWIITIFDNKGIRDETFIADTYDMQANDIVEEVLRKTIRKRKYNFDRTKLTSNQQVELENNGVVTVTKSEFLICVINKAIQ